MKKENISKFSERPIAFTVLAIFFILQGILHLYYGLISDAALFLGEIYFSGFQLKFFISV